MPPAKAQDNPYPGVTFTSEVIRHVNHQVTGADSSVATAEEFATPGYSEVGNSGAFIVGVQMSPAPGTDLGLPQIDGQFVTQVQSGARAAAAALVMPNDVAFFGQRIQVHSINASGFQLLEYPKAVPISLPVPIIVLPKITIVHKSDVDMTEWSATPIYTEVFYRTVKLSSLAYMGLLLQQQRTS